jgi:hypothetical protein
MRTRFNGILKYITRSVVEMNNIENAVVILTIALLVLACIVAYFLLRKYLVNTVRKSSSVLRNLEVINSKIKYKPIEQNHLHSYRCLSRAEFNRFDLENYFIDVINCNNNYFQNLIKTIEHNKSEKEKYKRMTEEIDFSNTEEMAASTKIPLVLYRYIQNMCYQEMLLADPTTDTSIICRKEYTTPTGRTHTWSDKTYNYKQLVLFYEKAQKIKEQRKIRCGQIYYERSLMTNSLRYDILKRDNFRCQICGSTAQDGVKLHIDHIVPVSKGGHTTPNNLRVLCDRCNLGKSDKIE